MIIAFCGHSDYVRCLEDEQKTLSILEKYQAGHLLEIWLGEYGCFDKFAYECARKHKDKYPETKLIFITPYIDVKNTVFLRERFDEILYPPIENAPLKYAISHRNRWVSENADIIVSYITRTFGGAYKMYQQARKNGKKVYNIALL